VPEQWGWVIETWQPPGQAPAGLVVHLQDLHLDPKTQLHLSHLIDHLRKTLGIKLVASEGAEGLYDTGFFSAFPDKRLTERISRVFLDRGLFSGAEYYAITHPRAVTLVGVEDAPVYLEHLRTYQQGARDRAALEQTVATLRQALRARADTVYPPMLRRLLTLRDATEQNQPADHAFATYVQELVRVARSHKIDLAAYPQVRVYSRMLRLFQQLDMRVVEQDRDRLLEHLGPRLSATDRQRLQPRPCLLLRRRTPQVLASLQERVKRGVKDQRSRATPQRLRPAPDDPRSAPASTCTTSFTASDRWSGRRESHAEHVIIAPKERHHDATS
jgi:hypothetical protein